MLEEKTKHPQEKQLPPPAHPSIDVTKQRGEAKDLKPIHGDTDIVYPSGMKLALLITSVFVSMFLVSLVRYGFAFGCHLKDTIE
jgi:hypothetical protein